MSQASTNKSTLQAQAVADYLAAHPDFFLHHKALLEVMEVPHDSGKAVSLVERQTSLLRERNLQLTTHLSELIDIARQNDAQLEKTERLVLSLLDAATLDEVAIAIEESLCRDFYSDTTALLVFAEHATCNSNLRQLPRQTAGVIEPLIRTNLPTCGQLQPVENRFLFTHQAMRVQSAAVVPLVKGHTLGLLAIGSFDPCYFQSSQGTLFLSYVGEVVSRVVSQINSKGAG